MAEVPYIATFRDEARVSGVSGGYVVRENTGRLHNDMLVDRIALVPIHLTRAETDNFIPGSITVHLEVINRGSGRVNVTSRDLRVKLFDKPHPNSDRCYPPCAITGDWPLITRLYPGEQINLVATLEKSVPSRHAAFAVVSLAAVSPALDSVAYMNARKEIEQDEALDDDARSRALNYHDHITRKRMLDTGGVEGGEPVSHDLTVESASGLTGAEIVSAATDILIQKFSSSALAYEARVEGSSIVFTVSGQGHTFGNVLQDLCMLDREALGINSIGYYETHPLEDRIVVRVDMPGGEEESGGTDPAVLISKLRVHCVHMLERVRKGGRD